MSSFQRIWVPVLAVCLLSLQPSIAVAGDYECTEVDGGGVLTVNVGATTTQYPLSEPSFGPVSTSTNGNESIAVQFEATYRFVWVPSEDENEADGTPTSQQRYLNLTTLQEWAGTSGFEEYSAAVNASWCITLAHSTGTDEYTLNATLENTPNPTTISSSGTWGEDSGVIPYTLAGLEPTVTLTITGSITTNGPAGGTLSLQVPAPGATGPEGIWHLYPVKGHFYQPATTITPHGRWRGQANETYRIKFYKSYRDPGAPLTFITEELLDPSVGQSGGGGAKAWTGNALSIVNQLAHRSIAKLGVIQNGAFVERKQSIIQFNGQ